MTKEEKPAGVPPDEVREMVLAAFSTILLADAGIEPHGFHFAVVMCENKDTGRVSPMMGIYRIDSHEDGSTNIAWMPLFAFVNLESEIDKWQIVGDEGDGTLMRGKDLELVMMPVKGRVQ